MGENLPSLAKYIHVKIQETPWIPHKRGKVKENRAHTYSNKTAENQR